MDESTESGSISIYKYRRRKGNSPLFVQPLSGQRLFDGDDTIECEEIRSDENPRHYTILQETRSEFTNTKIRYALLVYSNPAWRIFVLTILAITYIMDTWLYAFKQKDERPLWLIIVIICLNFIFTLDVVVVIGLKFFKKWRKTLNLVEPDNTHVAVDSVLAIPFSILYLVKINTSFDFYAIPPIIALMRVYRIIEYFYNRSSQAGSNQWTTFLFQYLILFLMSVHTWTCVWYLFSYGNSDIIKIKNSWAVEAVFLPTENIFDWYFVCAYWSVMFLTSNALGDLYPVTTIERITAIMAILLGFLLTTVVFVGSLTSQFLTITTRRSKYIQQLKRVKNHLHLIGMDLDTTTRIIRYYEDLWYQKSGVFKPKVLGLLPYPLQMEICYDLNAVPLYSSLLFRKLPDSFLRRLSLAMCHQFYLPGDVVFKQNQNKTMMVCITNGVMELLSDEDDESPIISFSKGTCFGEIALFYSIPAKCTVKAATYVECQVLEKTEFIKLMITYPELVDDIRLQITERIARAGVRKETHEDVIEMASLNIYASKNRKKSNIKRLKDKLRYIQEKTNEDLSKDDYLDENCLDLYILSEHVKKRLTSFTCITNKFPWILEYDCNLVKYWELYMLLNVFYICIFYPFFIGIQNMFPGGFFFYIEIIITFSLITNLLITAGTAVKTKKKYIDNLGGILNYRMKTLGFYLDLISIIPFENLVSIHTTVGYTDNYRNQLFYVCKGIKLCLIWRVSSFFEQMERKLLTNTIMIKVTKYVFYICLLCYWSGVILIMESCFANRCSENSWFAKILTWEPYAIEYANKSKELVSITGLYFSTTILLAVGYGDLTPGDQYDMAFVAFLTLYGVLLSGYCVAEFSTVITHWTRTKTAFLEVIITIENFMKENHMHPAIKSRIIAFSELQWQYNSGVDFMGDNWLEKTIVPSELRKKVLHQARFKALTSIKFFQVKNKAFIHTLTESARDIILPPGEIVYYGGTVTRELYIIESGYCLLTFSDTISEKKIERVIGPGNHLGLLVLLYGVPAVSTVITITHCKLISIGYYAYTSALSLFPDMREHDNLLTSEEIQVIETLAKNQNSNAYLQHYNNLGSKIKVHIRNILSQFLDNSFINVLKYYKTNKKSYLESYKKFNVLNNIAPYLLLPIVMKPDGIFLKTWATFRVTVAFSICILIPIVVSASPLCSLFNELVVTLEIICYFDMYLMMHVGYYGPKKQLIYHPYLTAKNYLKGPFAIDLLTSFPWYALWKLFIPNHDEGHTAQDHLHNSHLFHCTLRMINVTQIYKLHAAFWAESIGALKRAYLMSVVQFLLLMLFFLNFYMCILVTLTCKYVVATSAKELVSKLKELPLKKPYMTTVYSPNGNMICKKNTWLDQAQIVTDEYLSPLKVYLLAYYWTAATFSGAGFGDITAQDFSHMILSICVMIHGTLFCGYVYAKIASLKAVADQVLTKFEENLKHLDMFMTKEKVPSVLKRNVIDYWKYQWKRTGGWSHQSILGKLHANLNEDAVLYMYEKTLREIPLFEDVECSFFRAFAKKLKEVYFQKGYMVIRSNEVITTMYIIYRGKVDIVSDINEVEACMGPGGIFGNIRGATRYLTMSNIIASRNIDLLAIQGSDFYALLKSYPSVLRKVIHSVNSAAKDYVLPTTISDRTSVALGSIPISYIFEEDDDDDDEFPNPFMESPERSITGSHGSRSIASGNVDYISAGYLLFFPNRWFRRSVIPDTKWFTIFDYLILCISYIDFMLLVYQMAFLSNEYFFHICICFDILFLYKLFLDFHSGYMNRYGDYILIPKKVRKVFFSNVLHRRRDFLANLPISYIAFALPLRPVMQMNLFTYLRTPQLSRISHLFTFKLHRKVNIGSTNLIIKLMKIAIWASILTHVNACLFFKLSCLTPVHCTSNNWLMKSELNLRIKLAESNFFSIYITALWYMINLLTISGTGDVSSQNDFEVVETIITIIIIKFCTGLLISEMSAMITAHSSSRIAYDYGINKLKHGLRDMGLSSHQMSKMWDYVRKLWNRQQGRQMPVLTNELPFGLRSQLMQAFYGIHIRQSVIFRKTEDDFKRMLVMWMKHCVFFPGNYIVQCGDSDQCIYFIHRGEVEVLTVHQNLTESIYDILGPEDSFGIAQGLYIGISHYFSFRARTVVDIVHLKLDQWNYLLDFYPNSAKIVQRKVENVYLAI